ncbi:MAG TPA: glycosyltransferase 87 family protein [Gaiellaceae bacterium]|nr:glycosyltransferase 87 family protein [Gaiellaceae bacterium]
MSVLAKSWSASTEPRRLFVGAVGLFLVSMTLLHWGWYQHALILDTVEYHRYGDAMVNGHVPYRDFAVEYPPGALPAFGLPALGNPSFSLYNREFQILMALCGVGALAAMALALRALGASLQRTAAALGFFALSPLVLGSVILYRYDLWPAALTVAGLAAVLLRRERLGLAAIGLGVAAKAFPAAVVPPAVAYVWRTRGRREALLCLGVALAVALAVTVPFLALAPHGVWESVVRQSTRPLQIESLGSALLLAAHHTWGLALTMESSHGSQNLVGSLPHAVGSVSSALLAAVLAAIWVAAARAPATPERLVRYAAASLTAFMVFDKVLSPQFLIWLLPVVPLVRGRRGLAASALLGLALLLTQVWFPIRYFDLVAFEAFPSWVLLARDLVLLALLAVLTAPAREPARS